MTTGDIKIGFRPLNGKRIKVCGALSDWRPFSDRFTQRDHVGVCLQSPEHDGEVLATHVWVGHADSIKEAGFEPGERVSFTAIVKEYPKNGDGRYLKDYMLDYPQEVHWPDREAPALRIPAVPTSVVKADSPAAAVATPVTPPAVVSSEPCVPAPMPGLPPDIITVIRNVKSIAHQIGGKQKLLALIEEVLP